MQRGPGEWYKQFVTEGKKDLTGSEDTLASFGEDISNKVLESAQVHVSSFSVIITTMGKEHGRKPLENMRPASGVIVQIRDQMYGILTAAHVLRRSKNTRDRAEVTLLASSRGWDHRGVLVSIPLSPRPFTSVGFHNDSEEGPDLAIIPLKSAEWRRLNNRGMVAYNLRKQRFSENDVAGIGGPITRCVSIIDGVNYKASQIVRSHTDGEDVRLTMMASDTRVQDHATRGGYDYLELPSKTTENSYPACWKKELPGTAAEEIEELREIGVTQEVWSGVSGAGVWNLAIAANADGKPYGRVLAELAGICFYANPDKGCIIAHGDKSIQKIAAMHEGRPWSEIIEELKE